MNNHPYLDRSWPLAKLGEICTVTTGKSLSAKISDETVTNNLKSKNNNIYLNSIYISAIKFQELNFVKVNPDTLSKFSFLIPGLGEGENSNAQLSKEAIIKKSICYSVVDTNRLSTEYLYYYLFYKREEFLKYSKEGNRITAKLYSKINVPLPPIEIQKELVGDLKKKIRLWDIQIEKIRKKIAALEVHQKKVLNNIFINLAISPHDSKMSNGGSNGLSLKDCGFVQIGKMLNGSIKEYYGKSIPYFNPSMLDQGMNVLFSNVYLSQRGMKIAKVFEAGSVLFCCAGSQFGKVGIARTMGACTSQIIAITPFEGIEPEFLYYYFYSQTFHNRLTEVSKNNSISKSLFEALSIDLPTKKRQIEINEILNVGFKKLYKNKLELEKQLRKAQEDKKEILTGVFSFQ